MRKKLLKQDTRIFFSYLGKQCQLNDIMQELATYIDSSSDLQKFAGSFSLVGKRVNHKFESEDTHAEKWYTGTVVEYDSASKFHTIKCDGEADQCQFDLIVDIIIGDLVVMDN